MRRSTVATGFGIAWLLASGGCRQPDSTFHLIGAGNPARLWEMTAAGCPAGWSTPDFDDHGWSLTQLPVKESRSRPLCLRIQFDTPVDAAQFRWLRFQFQAARSHVKLNLHPWNEEAGEPSGLDSQIPEHRADDPDPPDYWLDLQLWPALLRPGQNVLALQAPVSSAPLALEATLRHDSSGQATVTRVTKGPYLVRPTATSVQVVWETNQPAPSLVMSSGRPFATEWARHHRATVDGLTPGQRTQLYVVERPNALPSCCIPYLVPEWRASDGESPTTRKDQPASDDRDSYVCRDPALTCPRYIASLGVTALPVEPLAPEHPTVRIGFVGGNDSTVFARLTSEQPALIVHTGDLTRTPPESGNGQSGFDPDARWSELFEVARPLFGKIPFAATKGEKDASPLGPDRFAQLFAGASDDGSDGLPYYSLDLGPVHLVLLDTTYGLTEQAAWLDADLRHVESSTPTRSIVVALHDSPFGAAPSPAARAALAPIFAHHRIAAVVSGHADSRSHGVEGSIPFFITGSGTAAPSYLLLELRRDGATAWYRGASGDTLEALALSRP